MSKEYEDPDYWKQRLEGPGRIGKSLNVPTGTVILKCCECGHEQEVSETDTCNWCGSDQGLIKDKKKGG